MSSDVKVSLFQTGLAGVYLESVHYERNTIVGEYVWDRGLILDPPPRYLIHIGQTYESTDIIT